jgi:hypothetical protein
MRSDEKPLRVGSSSSSWFRAWANRSYPEGNRLLLCISTARVTLADLQMNIRYRQTKDGESRDKVSTGAGKKSGRAP